jgi:hypothetical protein
MPSRGAESAGAVTARLGDYAGRSSRCGARRVLVAGCRSLRLSGVRERAGSGRASIPARECIAVA